MSRTSPRTPGKLRLCSLRVRRCWGTWAATLLPCPQLVRFVAHESIVRISGHGMSHTVPFCMITHCLIPPSVGLHGSQPHALSVAGPLLGCVYVQPAHCQVRRSRRHLRGTCDHDDSNCGSCYPSSLPCAGLHPQRAAHDVLCAPP